MQIVFSTYAFGHPQEDGRFYVTELHTSADGQVFRFEYLSEGVDPVAVMQARSEILNKQLEEKAAVQAAVIGTTLPLTVYEFLKRFTVAERIAIRASAKTDVGVEDFADLLKRSDFVHIANNDVQDGLAYLVSKDILTAERAAEIKAV